MDQGDTHELRQASQALKDALAGMSRALGEGLADVGADIRAEIASELSEAAQEAALGLREAAQATETAFTHTAGERPDRTKVGLFTARTSAAWQAGPGGDDRVSSARSAAASEDRPTPAARRAAKAEKTRFDVVVAAALVFARKGYEGASIADISQAAGYTKGALYAHFATKADLFLAVIEGFNEESSRNMPGVDAVCGGFPGRSSLGGHTQAGGARRETSREASDETHSGAGRAGEADPAGATTLTQAFMARLPVDERLTMPAVLNFEANLFALRYPEHQPRVAQAALVGLRQLARDVHYARTGHTDGAGCPDCSDRLGLADSPDTRLADSGSYSCDDWQTALGLSALQLAGVTASTLYPDDPQFIGFEDRIAGRILGPINHWPSTWGPKPEELP